MLSGLFNRFDSLVFLDLETSGLNPRENEIIEFGALRVRRAADDTINEERISCLIRLSPGQTLSDEITKITGISASMLEREGVEKSELCDILTELFGTGQPLVIAYNAQFDMSFLYHFLQFFGKAQLMKNIRMLDALTVYKDRRNYPHRLENAVASYHLEIKNTHRAVDDAAATYALLCAMEAEENDLTRYVNLFGYNPKFGVSGAKISSVKYVPQPYVRTNKAYEL